MPSGETPVIHERAVAREPTVDQLPALGDPLEPCVDPRDLCVPVQHEIRRRPAADGDRLHAWREREPLLPAITIAEEEKRLMALGMICGV